MFPVIISAPRPTVFFVRDDDDKFDIDIEKINKGTYSPLKLHRVSFFLDVGLEYGTPIGFGFDGSMIVPRNPSVSTPDAAIDCFNRVKASLMVGGLPIDDTTEAMIGFGELKETGYFRYGRALGAEAQISQALQEGGAGGQISICLLNPPRITEAAVKEAYSTGRAVFSRITRLNAAFLTLSYSCLRRFETRKALIFGWIACEQVIEQFWQDVFLSDETYFSLPERRARLKKLQNVSQKVEMMFQADVLSRDAYKSLSVARKARNDFAHRGDDVPFEDAFECVSALLILIEEFLSHDESPTKTKHLLEVFADREELEAIVRDDVSKAEDLDWSEVKYWREVYKIPGDEKWDGDDGLVDGIPLMDASADLPKPK